MKDYNETFEESEIVDSIGKKANVKKGPISFLLQMKSLRKQSNKSDGSKMSVSTQFSQLSDYVSKNEYKYELEDLDAISDLELSQNSSFHSSFDGSDLSESQVIEFEEGGPSNSIDKNENEDEEEEDEEEIFEDKTKKPHISFDFDKVEEKKRNFKKELIHIKNWGN